MYIKIRPLASGSSGNCTLLSAGGSSFLIDVGLSAVQTESVLSSVGIHPRDIRAVLITHEHLDHVRGLGVLCRKYGWPVYANMATWAAIRKKHKDIPQRCIHTFGTGKEFSLGPVEVTPFLVPHDAAEPVGFVFSGQGLRCGIVTDTGCIDDRWVQAITGCQLVMLEANHDGHMLSANGALPLARKERIASRLGHLSNEDCAAVLVQLAKAGAKTVYLCHLSEKNNTRSRAMTAAQHALTCAGYTDINVRIAERNTPSSSAIIETKR